MFALGGIRESWREVPLARIATTLEIIPRLYAERDLVGVDVAAFPHWGGPKGDPRRGDRARTAFRNGLVSRATGGESGFDEQGRKVINERMHEQLTAIFGAVELPIDG